MFYANEPNILIPDMHWPMLSQKIGQARMTSHHYAMKREGVAGEIMSKMDEIIGNQASVSAVYTNYPNNPTGLYGSREEIKCLMDELNKRNKISDVMCPYKSGHLVW